MYLKDLPHDVSWAVHGHARAVDVTSCQHVRAATKESTVQLVLIPSLQKEAYSKKNVQLCPTTSTKCLAASSAACTPCWVLPCWRWHPLAPALTALLTHIPWFTVAAAITAATAAVWHILMRRHWNPLAPRCRCDSASWSLCRLRASRFTDCT